MCLSRCSSRVKDWPQYVQKTMMDNECQSERGCVGKRVVEPVQERVATGEVERERRHVVPDTWTRGMRVKLERVISRLVWTRGRLGLGALSWRS